MNLRARCRAAKSPREEARLAAAREHRKNKRGFWSDNRASLSDTRAERESPTDRVGLAAHHEVRESRASARFHGLGQQVIRPGLIAVGKHQIGPVEVDGVDRGAVDETHEFDVARAARRELLEFFVGDDDEGSVVDLVAARDLIGGEQSFVHRADVAAPERGAVCRQQAHRDVALSRRGEQLDGNRHEPERDAARPDAVRDRSIDAGVLGFRDELLMRHGVSSPIGGFPSAHAPDRATRRVALRPSP